MVAFQDRQLNWDAEDRRRRRLKGDDVEGISRPGETEVEAGLLNDEFGKQRERDL